MLREIVDHVLNEHGFFTTSGHRFGVDMLCYTGRPACRHLADVVDDPKQVHADFLVTAVAPDASMRDLMLIKCRMAALVNKQTLLAMVEESDDEDAPTVEVEGYTKPKDDASADAPTVLRGRFHDRNYRVTFLTLDWHAGLSTDRGIKRATVQKKRPTGPL